MEQAKRIFVRTKTADRASGATERASSEGHKRRWKCDWAALRNRLKSCPRGMRLSERPDSGKGVILTLARIGAWFVLIGLILGVVSGGLFVGPFGGYIKKPPRAPLDSEHGDGLLPVKPSPGYRAPNFVGRLPDGTIISLDDCAGMPIILVFFRITSAPSIAQMPAVDRLYRERQDRCCVIAVAVFEREDDVGRYMAANDLDIPMIADIRGEIAQAYDITALPTTFIIDGQRIIKDLRIGAMTYAELERALKPLY